MKILFVIKEGSDYGSDYGCSYDHGSGGLLNSARFVVDMLNDSGIEAKLSLVVDNNSIDHEVHEFQPDVVIIEALWVVPEKFDVLQALHPNIRWIVRVHSDVPFLATEGIAIGWIFGYLERGVEVAFNNYRTTKDFEAAGAVSYLPNYYPLCETEYSRHDGYCFNVGCFGAIRPLKNHLLQAVAAIRYADKAGKYLRFHVNATRCEQGGDFVLKNLRSLFANTNHKLVEDNWRDHSDFMRLIGTMDVEMAVSFSETFSITAADAISAGVPLICSSEVPWASKLSIVPATDPEAMIHKLEYLHPRKNHESNHKSLREYSKKSKQIWLQEFGG
jgi:hypothetical protein